MSYDEHTMQMLIINGTYFPFWIKKDIIYHQPCTVSEMFTSHSLVWVIMTCLKDLTRCKNGHICPPQRGYSIFSNHNISHESTQGNLTTCHMQVIYTLTAEGGKHKMIHPTMISSNYTRAKSNIKYVLTYMYIDSIYETLLL